MLPLTQTDIEQVETLSSLGYCSKEIALVLDVKPSLFAVLCKDEETAVGKAYLRGVLEIERQKRGALLERLEDADTSITAIQIHDNHAKQQAFLDIKNDIYSDFDLE